MGRRIAALEGRRRGRDTAAAWLQVGMARAYHFDEPARCRTRGALRPKAHLLLLKSFKRFNTCNLLHTRKGKAVVEFSRHKQDFDRDGYVVVRKFLDAGDFRNLTQNLDRYIRDVVPGLPHEAAFYHDRSRPETLKQMQHMAANEPYFEAYRKHPRWRALAEALLGESVDVHDPEWFNKPPGTDHPTPAHQDNYYFCLKPANVVTIWLAIDPVGEENGCLRYVPGSHLRGIRPHSSSRVLGFSQGISDYGDDDRASEVKILLDPGDTVVHHGNTIHRAEANRTSDRNRRAFAMVMRGQSCERDEDAFERNRIALEAQHKEMGLKV